MPNRRKPTEILELNGAFKHNKDRTRAIGPKSKLPVGVAPNYLDGDIWGELVANSPAGVVTSADRILLELIVRLVTKLRNETISVSEMSLLGASLSKMGWTPADRSRINATPEKEAGGDLAFLNV